MFGGDLNEFELGHKRFFAYEFRIERQARAISQLLAQLTERTRIRNVVMWERSRHRLVTQPGCRVDPAAASVPYC